MSEVGAQIETGDAPAKTPKQLEKEAKKAAKLAKFAEKLDKKATETPKEVSFCTCNKKFKFLNESH